MDLSVCDVWCIDGPDLPALIQSKVNTFFWFPCSIQNFTTPARGAGKQVGFKILDALFPADAIATLAPIEKHLSVAEYLPNRSESGTPLLLLFLPLGFAALVPGFTAFMTVHKGFSPSVQLSCRVPSKSALS